MCHGMERIWEKKVATIVATGWVAMEETAAATWAEFMKFNSKDLFDVGCTLMCKRRDATDVLKSQKTRLDWPATSQVRDWPKGTQVGGKTSGGGNSKNQGRSRRSEHNHAKSAEWCTNSAARSREVNSPSLIQKHRFWADRVAGPQTIKCFEVGVLHRERVTGVQKIESAWGYVDWGKAKFGIPGIEFEAVRLREL
ncbi:hypothetical protein C8J57DRAFT_1221899 [Mycena rebaudengoi]|nr:hypothetical protein C8J57DRAFT_1221899 [Mycena rebaudengoi]